MCTAPSFRGACCESATSKLAMQNANAVPTAVRLRQRHLSLSCLSNHATLCHAVATTKRARRQTGLVSHHDQRAELVLRMIRLRHDRSELSRRERIGQSWSGAFRHIVGNRYLRFADVVRVIALGKHTTESIRVARAPGVEVAAHERRI